MGNPETTRLVIWLALYILCAVGFVLAGKAVFGSATHELPGRLAAIPFAALAIALAVNPFPRAWWAVGAPILTLTTYGAPVVTLAILVCRDWVNVGLTDYRRRNEHVVITGQATALQEQRYAAAIEELWGQELEPQTGPAPRALAAVRRMGAGRQLGGRR